MHVPVGNMGQRVLAAIEALPPLKARKNPYAAFAAGLFGAAGNGLYLRTWRDFGVSLGINIGFSVVAPGAGTLASLLVSAGYGFHRVRSSNAKLAAIEESARLAVEQPEQLEALPPARDAQVVAFPAADNHGKRPDGRATEGERTPSVHPRREVAMSETLDVVAVMLAVLVVMAAAQRRPERPARPAMVRAAASPPYFDTNEWRATPRPMPQSFSD